MRTKLQTGFTIIMIALAGLLTAVALEIRAKNANERAICVKNQLLLQQARNAWDQTNRLAPWAHLNDLCGPGKQLETAPKCPCGGQYFNFRAHDRVQCTKHPRDRRITATAAGRG